MCVINLEFGELCKRLMTTNYDLHLSDPLYHFNDVKISFDKVIGLIKHSYEFLILNTDALPAIRVQARLQNSCTKETEMVSRT